MAAVFGCAVMTGVGAALNTAGVRPGQKVAVIGLGGVGLSGLLGAKLAGPSVLIAIDVNPAKLGLTRHIGAEHAVDSRYDDRLDQGRDLTRGRVDVRIWLAGSDKAAETGLGVPLSEIGIPH